MSQSKLRVVHVIATLNHGGAEHQLLALLRGLDRDCFEPIVCCLRMGGPLESNIRDLGIETVHFNRTHKANIWAVAKLAMWLRQRNPDIVHTWLPTSNLWGRIAGISSSCRVLITSERMVGNVGSPIRRFIDRSLAKHTAAIVVNSQLGNDYLSATVGIPFEKLKTIHNGLDLEHVNRLRALDSGWKSRLTSEFGFPQDSLIVGTVAGIRREKKLDDFVKIAGLIRNELPQARFIIVGGAVTLDEQAYLQSLRDQISDRDLEKTLVISGIREDPIPYYLAMDLFVQTSQREGLPNAVMEAMSCSVPVIATDVGGTSELIQNGLSGYLVSTNDPDNLALLAIDLLRAPEQRKMFGCAAAARMNQCFSVTRMTDATTSLYREVIANRDGSKLDQTSHA